MLNMEKVIVPLKADFFSRAMAMLIDFMLLAFLAFVNLLVFIVAALLFPPMGIWGMMATLQVFVCFFVFAPFVLAGLYFLVLHSFGGQTLGKVFMGIQVVPESGDFFPLAASFLRLVGYLVSMLPFGAGFLWAVLDKNQSAWHDKLCGSKVISLE